MPHFRNELATGDRRPLTPEIVRELCADVTRLGNFFVAPSVALVPDVVADEESEWELYRGRLLGRGQTRQQERFQTWGVHLVDEQGERSVEPVVAVRLAAASPSIFVTRAVYCHAHESYDAGGNVILTREVQHWQRELVGTVRFDQLADAGSLRDELACLLFEAVVGTSRLPLTSIEAPLPGFTFGQLGYCYRPVGCTPMKSVGELYPVCARSGLAEVEAVKLVELSVRATPATGLADMAEVCGSRAGELLTLLRAVFNSLSLSPYTDFAPKVLALVRQLADRGHIAESGRADFLAHLVRQLSRHLAAYDLVAFHHRGANYPDALLLADLLGELLPLAHERPELFAGPSWAARLRRRAVRNGLVLQLEYSGHPVPDWPTSPGENLRVLPAPFGRVPDEQIYSPVTRHRRLFTESINPDSQLVHTCFADLDVPSELIDLGTALFLDRPLGFAKAPGEPDRTLLASHLLFSRTVAENRLAVLARRPDWLPDEGTIGRWRERLRHLYVDGLPLENVGPPPRPGVVSFHDARRVADDWVFLRTTRQTIRDFERQFDLRPLANLAPESYEWRLLIPGGTDGAPTLCVYDDELKLRLELAADLSGGYRTRGGVEFPADGMRVVTGGSIPLPTLP